jgi:hypothetical protein
MILQDVRCFVLLGQYKIKIVVSRKVPSTKTKKKV